MTRIKNYFSTVDWLNNTCAAYCKRLAKSFKIFWHKNSQNNINEVSQASLTNDFQHQMQLHQHNACFMFLELLLLWHYLNKVWFVFRFSVSSFLMPIWKMQMSNMKQHQQSDQWTNKHKTYTEHSFHAPYWYSHSVIFNLCLVVQNQGILKIHNWFVSYFYCLIRRGFSFGYPYRLYH